MLGVILMSGKGERFSKVGYLDPKPLIQIDQKMMFEYSLDHFSYPDKFIFVVNKSINENPKFINFIENFSNDHEIIIHDEVTSGQATSLYLAIKDVSSDQGFFVSSCDLSFMKINDIPLSKNIIFTTKPERHHIENANQYGWVEYIDNEYKVSCKERPNTNNNLSLVTGCFYFQSLFDFKLGYENMVQANSKINNEYYLDNIFNFEPISFNTSIVNVDMYKSFGSPEEIK